MFRAVETFVDAVRRRPTPTIAILCLNVSAYNLLYLYMAATREGWTFSGSGPYWYLILFGNIFISIATLPNIYTAGWGILLTVGWIFSPSGRLIDILIPPEDAEHRAHTLEMAFDKWQSKFKSKKVAHLLYAWHSTISVLLYWFDRVIVKLLG